MASVLIVGIDPHAVPGLDGEAVSAALERELMRFGERGIDAGTVLVTWDGSAEGAIVEALAKQAWDVVVVGGGIRKAEALLPLFEQVVNLVRQHAPGAAIAFNTSVSDSVEAAERWL
ncbi:hypothetical protein ACFV4P_07770 [Kitasatospora sp. NPDC059795]|uniref:hypothetical protein n=1 Tax=Kitasatospora sp. NPDC059795 TaxID=3346949 RepID=UPI003658092D